MERANSADTAIPRFAQFLGPPLAGVLIVAFGATGVLWMDAATFAFSAELVAVAVPAKSRIDPRPTAGEHYAGSGFKDYLTELLEGLRFVAGNALILTMILVVTVANLLDAPLVSVVLPVYAKTIYGSALDLGLMLGAFGAGALAGTLLYGVIGHRLPRRLVFLLCFVIAGPLGYWVLAATPPLPVVAGAFAHGGVIGGPINPLIMTVLQERTPQKMRGRVFGVLGALAQGGVPLGMALSGFLVEGVGLLTTIVGMGACYLAVTASMFFNPALRKMNARGEW